MSDPMIVPPMFWEWFNIWLIQFLKDLYHEIKMIGLRGENNTSNPYSHTCANHGSQPTGIDMTLNIPTSLTMSSPPGAPLNQINLQSLSTVSLQFLPSPPQVNPGSHNHHSHNHHSQDHHMHSASHNHVNNLGLGSTHINSLGSSGSHSLTNSLGSSSNSHTNSLGLNAGHNLSSSLGQSGGHSLTNSIGLGGSHNHSNSLGFSATHGNSFGLGSGDYSQSSTLGLSGNNSLNTNLDLGGSYSTNISAGGNHSHSTNHGLGGSHSHTINLGLGGSHNHTTNHGLGGSHSHTINLGLGGSHNHSTNHGLSGNHSHTINLGLGGSQNQTSNLGLSGSHSHHTNLGLSGSHNHITNIGLSGNHSHTTNLGQGGNHNHTVNPGLGGVHSHSTNHGQVVSNNHTTTNLSLGSSHSSNLSLGGSHSSNIGSGGSHNINLGLSGSQIHVNNLGLSGNHDHGSNIGLTHSSNLGLGVNHNLTSNLGIGGTQSYTSNLGSCHSHGDNSGLNGNHSNTIYPGLSASHSHSNINLGSHNVLINSVNPTSSVNSNSSGNLMNIVNPISIVDPMSNVNLNISHDLSTSQGLSGIHNLNSSQNLSIVPNQQSNLQNQCNTSNTNQAHQIESSQYATSNCVLSPQAQQYQLLQQSCRPVECYHQSGATAATYMPSSTGGTQSSSQASLRVQPTPPQPTAPPAPQQDNSKTTMASHNFVSQTQTTPRPQYNFQPYRATQHGSRPNSIPRQQQQQPFIPSATSSSGPVMYPILFQPTHMGMQTYQQQRSGSPGYYPYHVGPYIGYNSPPSHTSPYYGYAANSQQLPTPSLQSNSSGGRNNPTTLVGSQTSPATPSAPAASLPHTQTPAHLQSMAGIRPSPVQKRSHRLQIIDPVTRQDIFSDLYPTSNEYFLSGEQNDRQTPQPEPPTHSIAEEFTRMVNEAANQPSLENAIKTNFVPKNVELPVSSTSTAQPQNAISSMSSINNNVIKSDLVNLNDNRSLGPDAAASPCETPVVSAISDSPVIVPKMTLNVKPTQKIETTVQSIVLDTSKNTQINKQSNNKSSCLLTEKVDKEKDISNPGEASAPVVVPAAATTWTTATAMSSPLVTMAAAVPGHLPAHSALSAQPITTAAPQPQRVPRDRLHKSEEKEKHNKVDKEIIIAPSKQNGPSTALSISSVDSFQQSIILPTSQNIQNQGASAKKKTIAKHIVPKELASFPAPEQTLTATELLSASIEKVAREHPLELEPVPEKISSAFEAQAKLTQSITSVCRAHQSESKMKDINPKSKTIDTDTANGNATEGIKADSVTEDINKNEKSVKNTKNNSKKAAKMAEHDVNMKEMESCENGKDETDKVVNVEQEVTSSAAEEAETSMPEVKSVDDASMPPEPTVFVPKYKYSDEQWSPLNKSGKKCYDIGLLKQIKEDPLSKNKPDAPLLEACNVIRTAPMQEHNMIFTPISRPNNDDFFPGFMKGGTGAARNTLSRDPKKDGRNMAVTGKGSVKLNSLPSNNSSHKQVIHVSLSLREDVKLNEVDSAWKPTRFRRENLAEDEIKTQELYKNFRGILNKLTPQKFNTLLEKVEALEIDNQKRMEGVIDLLFEKAIEEPNFSATYANMCNKLANLKVPSDSNPDNVVNFRGLIISKCQNQFETGKSDEQVLKMENELAESTDPAKKKELQAMIVEENRKIRLRSVANVRFIGELFKLKMLTCKIMDYCMKNLIDKLEEEKLECLCKLLTTIGQQIENESVAQLDNIFKKMHEIVDRKSNKISSRVKFMIQDVIDLRRKRWVIKSVVDSQPKMMDQIQKEAEQQQRNIELMNASGMGGGGGGNGGGGGSYRREEGGRGKRGGDNRRPNAFDNNYNRQLPKNVFSVDTIKLKGVTQQKNLAGLKLAPTYYMQAAGAKPQQTPATSNINISSNMYSVLEDVQGDPTSFRANRDSAPAYHTKGASIERSTFNTKADYTSGAGRSGSVGVARPASGAAAVSVPAEAPAPAPCVLQESLSGEKMRKAVKCTIDLSLINPDDEELVSEMKQQFPPQYHAAVVAEILNVVLEKNVKEINMIAKSLFHVVATKTISPENFVAGLKETFEFLPDLFIDIPMLYENLGKILAPHIEVKHITFEKMFDLSKTVILANQGHFLLKAIIHCLNESMGPTFVRNKWQESGLQLTQWMSEEQSKKWIADNKFEFLEGGSQASEESTKILTPAETQSKLLQLMKSDENCECIKGWVQDKLGKASNEDWFMRALIQAICEQALEGREVTHVNQDRMLKYAGLIHEFGESKESREANCLFGIQHLIHRLEHPQGVQLALFQYLHEQYLITLDGFIAWEESEKEPEGKGVMLKALTSFFTNIKEADNEDSGSDN